MQCMEVWGGNRAVDNGVVMPGLDAWVFSLPHRGDEAGGDIHYVSSCATGRITRMLIADVSGHGSSVAETARELRDLMKRYVNYLDQSRFVGELNSRFNAMSSAGSFATAFAATFWAPTSYLLACNAGHPPPLWRSGSTGQWKLLTPENARTIESRDGATNLPLGVSGPTEYEQFGVRLRKDDLVLIYTDAVIETPIGNGKRLGVQGLLEMVERVEASSPDGFIRGLRDLLDEASTEGPLDDDLTLMLLRRNGMRPRMGPRMWPGTAKRYLQELGASVKGSRFPWPEMRLETIGGIFFDRFNQRWGRSEPGDGDSDPSA